MDCNIFDNTALDFDILDYNVLVDNLANNIIVSTDPKPDKSKSKAVYVSGPQGDGMKKLLCCRPLPWVARAEHLGHALSEDGTMLHDVHEKKARSLAR